MPEILLLLMVLVPLAVRATLLLIKVTEPLVFTLRFVNVLLLTSCDSVAKELLIYVCDEDPAMECVMPLISLLCMVNVVVLLPEVFVMPVRAPEFATLYVI